MEVNHRYGVVGERLTERRTETEDTLSGLKSYLMDVQQLMVYLNKAEPQVCTLNFYSVIITLCLGSLFKLITVLSSEVYLLRTGTQFH